MRFIDVNSTSLPNKLWSKALIKVGYACNSDCLFCHVDQYRGARKSEKAIVIKKMAQIKQRGFDMVCLSGGEVTIRGEFMEWARAAPTFGLLLGLVTNGRILKDAETTRELYDLGLRYAYVSFYGATKEVHNYIAGGMDCWQEQIDGIRNLAAYDDIDLTLNIVMCRQNLPEFRGIVDLFADLPHVRIKFSLMEPKGSAEEHYDDICPPIVDAAAAAKDAIEYGETVAAKRGNMAFGIDGIPPCLVGDAFHRRYSDNLMTHGIYYMTETWEQRFFHVDDLNKKHMAACQSCSLAHRCPGIPAGYEGTAEGPGLRPIQRRIAGSVTARRSKRLGRWLPDEPCPVRTGSIPLPPDAAALVIAPDNTLWAAEADVDELASGDLAWLRDQLGLVTVEDDLGTHRAVPQKQCPDCELSLQCPKAWVAAAPVVPDEMAPAADGQRSLTVRRNAPKLSVEQLLDPASPHLETSPEAVLELLRADNSLLESASRYDRVSLHGVWPTLLSAGVDLGKLRRLLAREGALEASGELGELRVDGRTCSPETSPFPADTSVPSIHGEERWVTSQEVLIELETAGFDITAHRPAGWSHGTRWKLAACPLPHRKSRPLQTPEVQQIIEEPAS